MVHNIHKSYSAMADNAGGWAKAASLRKRLRFLGEWLWLSPHGRARLRAQLARAKPEEPLPGGGDAAPNRVLSAVAHPLRRPPKF